MPYSFVGRRGVNKLVTSFPNVTEGEGLTLRIFQWAGPNKMLLQACRCISLWSNLFSLSDKLLIFFPLLFSWPFLSSVAFFLEVRSYSTSELVTDFKWTQQHLLKTAKGREKACVFYCEIKCFLRVKLLNQSHNVCTVYCQFLSNVHWASSFLKHCKSLQTHSWFPKSSADRTFGNLRVGKQPSWQLLISFDKCIGKTNEWRDSMDSSISPLFLFGRSHLNFGYTHGKSSANMPSLASMGFSRVMGSLLS